MISINFLSPPKYLEGMEFMDFQNSNFFDELRRCVRDSLDEFEGQTILTAGVEHDLYTIIEKYTGFRNIELKLESEGNLGVDVAYFSPKHVLNSEGIDFYFSAGQSTLGKWFQQNKGKIFKGEVDYATGKVSGAFADLPVKLYINRFVKETFPMAYLEKYRTTVADVLAACIVHELGHIFGGCMMVAQVSKDNIVLRAAIENLTSTDRVEDRVVIIKDAAKLLDLDDVKDKDALAIASGNAGKGEYLMYFTKMTGQRNTNRCLSLGVPQMTSEVLADAYAIRMGCERGLMPALAILYESRKAVILCTGIWMGVLASIVTIFAFPWILLGSGLIGLFTYGFFWAMFGWILTYFQLQYSWDYNSPHRRFDDAMRQLIAKFKEDKKLSPQDKIKLIKDLDQLLKLNNSMKPLFDNTVVYRTLGYIFNSGSDFKYNEFEHYTQVLANHEINLLGDKLANITR